MANLTPQDSFDNVYQVVSTDKVNATVFNTVIQALLNRTEWLKNKIALVSQDEAEAGTETTVRGWSALRIRQAITFGFSINLGSTKGHIKFPSYFGGFIFQYIIGAEDSSGQGSQTLTFDTAFTAVKCAGVNTQISTTSGESDAFYQSMPPSNTGIIVNRQVAGGGDDRPTKPIVWAVGS